MSDPAGPQTIREALDEIRNAGRVPLGVLSYDVAQEDFSLYLCPDVDSSEVNALLAKLDLQFNVRR
jgi:hypothetical protein